MKRGQENPFAALRNIKKPKTASPPVAAKKSPAKVAAAAVKKEAPVVVIEEPKEDVIIRKQFDPSSRSNVVSDGNGLALMAMQLGETLTFQGSVLMCPLLGSFTVNGYTFNASPAVSSSVINSPSESPSKSTSLQFYPCFSPKSSSFLVLESVKPIDSPAGSEEPDVDNMESDDSILLAINHLYSRLGKLGKSAATIIALKSMDYSGINVIEKRITIFKELFTLVPLSELNRDETFHIDGFHPVIEPNHPHPTLEIPPTWISAGTEVAASPSNPIVCIVGSKGLGKSTMSRFMVNQLLSKYPKVAFLDCDLGQPELTVSGQVSLHILNSPLLGPAFTNIKQPLHSCYLGATSPKNDPDCYSASLSQLWKIYKARVSPDIPLVINTDGWVKGMGFDLLLHSLKEFRPTHLIQLGLEPSSTAASSKNIRDDLHALLNSDKSLSPVKVIHAIGHDETTSRPSKFNAADMRNLAMTAYFAQTKMNPSEPVWISSTKQALPKLWNFALNMTSKVPYSVPWKAIRVRFLNVEVPPSQTLIALNGSLVGLVADSLQYSPKHEVNSNDDANINIVPSDLQIPPESQNCVGLGIVRGIDPVSKLFYIVTPLHIDQIVNVNLILRGAGVEYPVSMMLDGFENVRTTVPYVTYTVAEGIGGMARKIRTNLQRRKHQ
ncbi:Polynucleotide 5'-hydroxyl-kinase nol9 [Rhizoclosmatium sp. JEL0117]|nr:Polynucleotide 5'-hydroxyl-kinase nol9 [Rhizoclosmatium sp. JEL0117]